MLLSNDYQITFYRHAVYKSGREVAEMKFVNFFKETLFSGAPGQERSGMGSNLRDFLRFSLSTCLRRLLPFIAAQAFIGLPGNVRADSEVLLRIVDSIDITRLSEELANAKLSAAFRVNKNGDLVVKYFNAYSLTIAQRFLEDNPGMRKLMQRTSLQVAQKGKGVTVKLAFMF